jgi:hypothetical protein
MRILLGDEAGTLARCRLSCFASLTGVVRQDVQPPPPHDHLDPPGDRDGTFSGVGRDERRAALPKSG